MSKAAIVITIILLAFGLAGCGGHSNGTSVAPINSSSNQADVFKPKSQWISTGDSDWIVVWHLKNANLTCAYTDYNSDALSCNWEAYNAEVSGTSGSTSSP